MRSPFRPHISAKLSSQGRRLIVDASISITEIAIELLVFGVTVLVLLGALVAVIQAGASVTSLWPRVLLIPIRMLVVAVADQIGRALIRRRTGAFAVSLARSIEGRIEVQTGASMGPKD
jgi:hypothetical protein